mgnify:CR=1 FL=1
MKKTLAFAALALAGCQSPADRPDPPALADFQWEKRVVLHHNAPTSALKLDSDTQKAFDNRDLVFLAAGEDLQQKFRLTGTDPVFVLIGKDGGEKARQTGSLPLQKWFDLIDSMPMRQREMREEAP